MWWAHFTHIDWYDFFSTDLTSNGSILSSRVLSLLYVQWMPWWSSIHCWYVNFLNKTLPIQEVIYILKNESGNKSCSKLKKRYSLSFLSLLCSYIKILFVHYKIDNRFLWILLHQWKVRLPNYNGDNFLQSLLPHKISITNGGNSFCLFHPAVFPFHHKS